MYTENNFIWNHLQCIAEGQPKPSIEWRAPNDDVFRLTSDDFEGVTVHQDGSVLIEDIRNSDEGDYHCVAKVKFEYFATLFQNKPPLL